MKQGEQQEVSALEHLGKWKYIKKEKGLNMPQKENTKQQRTLVLTTTVEISA